MVVRDHKIHILHNDNEYTSKNSPLSRSDSELASNKSYQNSYNQEEAVEQFETYERTTSRPNSLRATFAQTQPYEVIFIFKKYNTLYFLNYINFR